MFHRTTNFGELEPRPGASITRELIKRHLPKFKRHDDLVIVHEVAWEDLKRAMPLQVAVVSENSPLSIDEDELASLVCQAIPRPACRRLAIERAVRSDAYRTPSVRLVLGDSAIVNHRDNKILYQFDVTKCMFSFGNVREKLRMAELDCSNEIVVDLFAGIGYFSLPLLVHARAKHLYACEWNPDALEALKRNLRLNKVDTNRCTLLEGDNRVRRPVGVAQRVVLGILPSCLEWMRAALECVDPKTGAILHCHDLVDTRTVEAAAAAAAAFQKDARAPSPRSELLDSRASAGSTGGPEPASGDQQAPQQPAQPQLQFTLNQSSISSSGSTSSHSTIEKLSAPAAEESPRAASSPAPDSDKDTSSPVLLEKPGGSSSANSSFFDAGSSATDQQQQQQQQQQELDSIIEEPPLIEDSELAAYEARGLQLIASIRDELAASSLAARLLHVQPVKSYAPHVTHVVFDIMLEPRRNVALGVTKRSLAP